jgi:hypothetical protein
MSVSDSEAAASAASSSGSSGGGAGGGAGSPAPASPEAVRIASFLGPPRLRGATRRGSMESLLLLPKSLWQLRTPIDILSRREKVQRLKTFMERNALFRAVRDKDGGKGCKTTFVRKIAALSGFFAYDFDGDPRLPLGAGTAADRIKAGVQLSGLSKMTVEKIVKHFLLGDPSRARTGFSWESCAPLPASWGKQGPRVHSGPIFLQGPGASPPGMLLNF